MCNHVQLKCWAPGDNSVVFHYHYYCYYYYNTSWTSRRANKYLYYYYNSYSLQYNIILCAHVYNLCIIYTFMFTQCELWWRYTYETRACCSRHRHRFTLSNRIVVIYVYQLKTWCLDNKDVNAVDGITFLVVANNSITCKQRLVSLRIRFFLVSPRKSALQKETVYENAIRRLLYNILY